MKKMIITLSLFAFVMTGCATGGSVGDYAMGDDSSAIKAGRNRESAQLSRAELEQYRRQRANTAEELDLEAKKRRNKQEEIAGAVGIAAGVAGTAAVIRSIFR